MQMLGGFSASARRSGFSIIYIPLILLLLVAFVAMAVDTGRIRLAKAQLQGAADASARAGVSGLPGFGIGGSLARAQLVAQANDVAEQKVVFDNGADIEWGYWDSKTRTFFLIN